MPPEFARAFCPGAAGRSFNAAAFYLNCTRAAAPSLPADAGRHRAIVKIDGFAQDVVIGT